MSYLRIEKPDVPIGRPHVVTNDRLIAVGDDGAEVDISNVVTEWHEHNRVGDLRTIEVVLLGYLIVQQNGDRDVVERDDRL